jgi:hypothetical protein
MGRVPIVIGKKFVPRRRPSIDACAAAEWLAGQIELAAMRPCPADFKTDSKMKRIGNVGS